MPTSRRLDALGIEHRLGADVVPVAGLTALVKSPGVPGEVPQVAAARAAGVPVWSEVELAARMLPENPIAGVTGTNGKTTTTHLLGAMLAAGGRECEVAGNVGRPLSELAGRVAPHDVDRLRALELPARGHRPAALPRRGDAERDARPPRPARDPGGVHALPSCASWRTRSRATPPS